MPIETREIKRESPGTLCKDCEMKYLYRDAQIFWPRDTSCRINSDEITEYDIPDI